jgi:hypothetical protein
MNRMIATSWTLGRGLGAYFRGNIVLKDDIRGFAENGSELTRRIERLVAQEKRMFDRQFGGGWRGWQGWRDQGSPGEGAKYSRRPERPPRAWTQERRLPARRTINTGVPSWRFFGTDSRVLRSETYRAPSPDAFLAIKVCPPWAGRLLPATVVHRQPDRGLVWSRPGNPVLCVGRDVEVVTWAHLDRLVLELDRGGPL